LPWTAARVVKASNAVTSGQKLVWLEIYASDRDERRCFGSASWLAKRLGMGIENVEKARRELKVVGLLDSAPPCATGPRRTATWWPELPKCCSPSSRNPTDDEIVTMAEVLDDWVRVRRQETGETSAPPNSNAPPYSAYHSTPTRRTTVRPHGVPQYATETTRGRRSASGGGEVGGGDSDLQKSVKTSPSSGSQTEEDRETEEDGPRARANVEEGAGASSKPANWREVLRRAGATPEPR
jgi:hypothetical protein